jgi:hypothetical protein
MVILAMLSLQTLPFQSNTLAMSAVKFFLQFHTRKVRKERL